MKVASRIELKPSVLMEFPFCHVGVFLMTPGSLDPILGPGYQITTRRSPITEVKRLDITYLFPSYYSGRNGSTIGIIVVIFHDNSRHTVRRDTKNKL